MVSKGKSTDNKSHHPHRKGFKEKLHMSRSGLKKQIQMGGKQVHLYVSIQAPHSVREIGRVKKNKKLMSSSGNWGKKGSKKELHL